MIVISRSNILLRAVALRCLRSGKHARESILGIVESMAHYEVKEKVKGTLPSGARGQGDKLGIRFNRKSLERRIVFARILKPCCSISWTLFTLYRYAEVKNFKLQVLRNFLKSVTKHMIFECFAFLIFTISFPCHTEDGLCGPKHVYND